MNVFFGLALLSIIGLALGLRHQVVARGKTRQDVAQIVTWLPAVPLFLWILFRGHLPALFVQAGTAEGWSVIALVLGAILCFRASGCRPGARGYIGLALVFSPLLHNYGFTRSSPASVRSQLDSLTIDLGVDDADLWKAGASLHGALLAVGAETPDLSALAARVSDPKGIELGSLSDVWTMALRMGLLDQQSLVRLAASQDQELEKLRADILKQTAGEELSGMGYLTYDPHHVELFLATEELNEESLVALTEMVMDLFPVEEDKFRGLWNALNCVRLLELLGRDDLIASLREPCRDLLTKYWMNPEGVWWWREAGGFTSFLAGDFPSNIGSTLEAVELMGRFGIPDGVDPFIVRNLLQEQTGGLVPLFPKDVPAAKARAGLLRLERQIGLPERSWTDWLVAQWMFVLAALLLALSFYAIWIAPQAPTQSDFE